MKIGCRSSHNYGLGGGFSALYWHMKALKDLGHEVTVFTTVQPSKAVLDNWVSGVALAWYLPGIEADFPIFINIDHFSHAKPLAKRNLAHIFFPMHEAPPDGIELYSNSNYTAKAIKEAWGRDAQTMYIPIGAEFTPSPHPKENIILHVSRFAEPNMYADKGHRQLIQAWKRMFMQMPGWELYFIGSVDPQQERYLSELSQRAAFTPSIKFFPSPSQEELVKLYQRAAILWHATGVSIPNVPSAQEHLGLSPLEAQACGTVPVVFATGGMPEVVLGGKTGFLFNDIDELPNATIKLIQDNYIWSTFQQQGMDWARSWQNYDNFKMRVAQMIAGEPIGSMEYIMSSSAYKASDVLAIIPTYNNVAMLKDCVASLKTTAPELRVLVINNGDPISEELGVKVVDAGQNLGFAGAYKFAEQFIDPNTDKLILALNDDVKAIHAGWLEAMMRAISAENVGIVGAKLLFANGRLQHIGGKIDWSRPDIGYHIGYGDTNSMQTCDLAEVDFVTGACMMVKQELFNMPQELVGGLHGEEIWMSMSAREKGFRTVYQPAATLYHLEGQTKARTQDTQDKIDRNLKALRERWQPK